MFEIIESYKGLKNPTQITASQRHKWKAQSNTV